MSDSIDKPSTFQSYVDSAGATLQSALGSITGNQGDKDQAAATQDKAEAKDVLSHTAAKFGGYTATAEGGVAKDDSNRQAGQWNQTIGSGKETLGNLTGIESLKQGGREQNRQGQAQEAQGQLNDLGKGVSDRLQGTVGGAIAGFTGDKEGQAHYQDMHDTGKAQQRGAEIDIQKQNPPPQ